MIVPNTPLSGNWCSSGKCIRTAPGLSSSLSCFPFTHFSRLRLCLADFPSLPGSSLCLGPLPSEVLWLLRAIKAPLHYWHIIAIHHLSAALLLYIMVLHQGNGRWQEPQTQRLITSLSFMACFFFFFFGQSQQIKARKAVLDCCHEAFKTFKYIYLYIFPLTLKH